MKLTLSMLNSGAHASQWELEQTTTFPTRHPRQEGALTLSGNRDQKTLL